MSYFTAVIAGDGRGWRARDVDVEDAGTLDDLTEMLRAASHRGGPVLAVIEREDEWFALVRVDDDEEPRLFVSDMDAAARSSYAELLAPAADVDVDGPVPQAEVDPDADPEATPVVVDDEEDDDNPKGDPEDDEPEEVSTEAWAGEPDLLEDLGVDGAQMRALVESRSDDPAGILGEVGETCGFGELLDALR